MLAVLVVQVKCHCLAQFTAPQIKRLEATCLLCLTLHNAETSLGACKLFAHQYQVFLSALQFALCFYLACAELGNTCCFFKNRPALKRGGAQHGVHLSLLNDGIGIVTDTRVHEEFLDVTQTHLAAVDEVLTATVCVESARDFHLIGIDGQSAMTHGVAIDRHTSVGSFFVHVFGMFSVRVHFGGQHGRSWCKPGLLFSSQHWIVKDQGHTCHAARLARGAACENDVKHGTAAQALGTAFAKHPLDSVNDVGLAASVWSNHANDRRVETEFGGVGKTLEAAQNESGKSQGKTSCRVFVASLPGTRGSCGLTQTACPEQGAIGQRGTVSFRAFAASSPDPTEAVSKSLPRLAPISEILLGPTSSESESPSSAVNSGLKSFSPLSSRSTSARIRSCSARKSQSIYLSRHSSWRALMVSL